MRIWNDTDVPLGYLITFRTYGTWLHGDSRGSIDRFHNQYKSPRIEPNEKWQRYNEQRLTNEALKLNAKQRKHIEDAIKEVCDTRKWHIHAINVRTNHVHTVVSIGFVKPGKAMGDFKSYATRRMRQNNCWKAETSPWADKGSKRWLWTERSIGLACDYVIYGQGEDLPDFD